MAQWWAAFKDPLLDSLIDRAVKSNLDLRIAEARVREERAALAAEPLRESGQRLMCAAPIAETALAKMHSDSARKALSELAGRQQLEQNLFKTALTRVWELDIFGGTRRSSRSGASEL